MLDVIAPFGIAEQIRELTLVAGGDWRYLAFAAMVAVYVHLLIVISSAIALRIDLIVATTVRRLSGAPPSLQIWIGDVLEQARPWSRRICIVFVLLTAAFVAAPMLMPIEPGGAIDSLRAIWRDVIDAIW